MPEGRYQGTFRAVAIIALIVVPPLALGTFAYRSYVESRREYLTRLSYRELQIAAGQFANQVGSLPLTWNLRVEKQADPCNEPTPNEEPIECVKQGDAPKKPGDAKILLRSDGQADHLFVRGETARKTTRWGKTPLARVVESLRVDHERFDETLLMTARGRVLYFGEPAAFSLSDAMSPVAFANVAASDGGQAARQTAASGVQTVTWHDTPHLLFMEPTGVRVGIEDGQIVELLVGGIVARDRFESQTRRIPYRWAVFAVVLLVLGLLSWPMLRLRLLGPQERLRRRDVRILVLAIVAMWGFWPGILLLAYTSAEFDADFDTQLPEIAAKLQTQFTGRLNRAFHVIKQAGATLDSGTLANTVRSRDERVRLSIVDPNGVVAGVWNVSNDAQPDNDTQHVAVNDRTYFQALEDPDRGVLRGEAWGCPANRRRCALEVIRSKRQGIVRLVVATRLIGRRVDPVDWRIVLAQVDIWPFRDPFLPPGIGFAIIDDTGKVHLHSNSARNMVENFFDALDDAAELRAVVKSRAVADISATYAGNESSIHVEPLGKTTWHLVVFRSPDAVRAVAVEVSARWAVLFVSYLAAGILALLAYASLSGRWDFEWFWPNRSLPPIVYEANAIRLALLSAFLVAAFWTAPASAAARVLLLGAVPVVALVSLRHELEPGATGRRETATAIAFGAIGGAALIAAVGRAGVLPVLLAFAPVRLLATACGIRGARNETRFRAAYTASVVTAIVLLSTVPLSVLFRDSQLQVREEFVRMAKRSLSWTKQDATGSEAGYLTSLARSGEPARMAPRVLDGAFGEATDRLSAWVAELLPVFPGIVADMREARAEIPAVDRTVRAITFLLSTIAVVWIAVVTLRSLLVNLFHLPVDAFDAGAAVEPEAATEGVFVFSRLPVSRPTDPAEVDEPALLDLRNGGAADVARWSARHRGRSRIEVQHLEMRLHDGAVQEGVLGLLEERVFDRDSSIVMTSAVDPYDYLRDRSGQGTDGTSPKAGTLERWSVVLSGLSKQYHYAPPTNGSATGEVGEALQRYRAPLASLARDEDDGSHRESWRVASRAEKLALRQLAEEGYVSPAAGATVRGLMRRRLVRRAPRLEIASEGLRHFVLRAEDASTIARWEAVDGRSGLETLGRIIPVLLIGGLVFVFATQREIFNATTTIVTAATTALPLLLRILGGGNAPSGTPQKT
jgi:hypothetical protein